MATFEEREAARKEKRGMNNAEFLELVSKDLKDADAIAVVACTADGTVVSYTAQDSSLESLGLFHTGAAQTLSDMEVGQ